MNTVITNTKKSLKVIKDTQQPINILPRPQQNKLNKLKAPPKIPKQPALQKQPKTMKKAPLAKINTKPNTKTLTEKFDRQEDIDYTMLDTSTGVYKYYNSKDDDTTNKKSNRCMCIDFQDMNDFNVHKRCNNKALTNSHFCEKHQNCTSYLRQFLSGSEPEYQPEVWSDPYIEGSHNCYSYFLNRQVKAVKEKCEEICLKKHKKDCPTVDNECSDLKPQPFDYELINQKGTDNGKERIYKCPNMQYKILRDNPTIKPVAFNQKCPPNYYKGAMVVDSGGKTSKTGNTFHFYRQDKSGTFSHKPGISEVSNVDASNKKPIYAPHFANRNYKTDADDEEGIFYDDFCGYYCIPTNEIVHKRLA
jgi:hypothetical protein